MGNQRKFLDKPITFTGTTSLERELNELKECLKSEGVNLSTGDILKAYDIYLRIVGIGRDANHEEEETLKAIFTIFGPVSVGDFTERIKSGEVELSVYETIYDEINDILEHKEKEDESYLRFENYPHVRESLMILFKEFTIFTNEILGFMSEVYNENPNLIVCICELDGNNESSMTFSIFTESTSKIATMSVLSPAICKKIPTTVSVIADTFPEEALKVMMEEANGNK